MVYERWMLIWWSGWASSLVISIDTSNSCIKNSFVADSSKQRFTVYRDQGMDKEAFKKMYLAMSYNNMGLLYETIGN